MKLLLRGAAAGSLILGTLLLASLPAQAQVPAWRTAAAYFVNVAAMTPDSAGMVYVVGSFRGTVRLGSTTLNSAGNSDAFVAQWSPALADFTWFRRLGGADEDAARAVAVYHGGVYVTGSFGQTADFGPVTLTATGPDMFVTRLTTSGGFGWAQQAGGWQQGGSRALAATAAGVYVVGAFQGPTAQFGSTTLHSTATRLTYDNGFIAKLTETSTGANFVWAVPVAGTDYNTVDAVAVQGAAVYVAGTFAGRITLVPDTLDAGRGGTQNMYVAKLLDLGTAARLAWTKAAGASEYKSAVALAVRGPLVYVAGQFSWRATFGSDSLLAPGWAIGNNAFVARLTDAGGSAWFDWATGAECSSHAKALAVRGSEVYVVGDFIASPMATFGGVLVPVAGGWAGFVAKLDASGRFGWVQTVDGPSSSATLAVANAGVYVGGSVVPSASFGTITLINPPGVSVGFVASLADQALAVAPYAAAAAIGLVPNPAHNAVAVELPAGSPAILTLTDALGRPVRSATTGPAAPGQPYLLALAGLPPGVYLLRVATGSTVAVRRLVVE